MTERQIGLVTDKMILRHNDKKDIFFLMTYHPSLTDLVSLLHVICYYRLIFPCFLS